MTASHEIEIEIETHTMSGAGDEFAAASASDASDELDEDTAEGDEEEGEEGEEEDPSVVIATLGDLGRHLPDALRKSFGDRPIWFIREDDQELVEIFERVPEDPMPKGRAQELLRGLRSFAEENSDRLQEMLGVSDSIVYAFHGDAAISKVISAFEEDGFFVLTGVIRTGEIVVPEA